MKLRTVNTKNDKSVGKNEVLELNRLVKIIKGGEKAVYN